MTDDRVYRTGDFDFALPPALIAQRPSLERSDARLLHVRPGGINDLQFRQLPSLLQRDDLLVFNDTRVIKSRVIAKKPSGGRVELMLERCLSPGQGRFQMRASHPPRPGAQLDLPGGVSAMVTAREGRFVDLDLSGIESLLEYLEQWGTTPLPPYITRPADVEDEARYQTVYAREPGAVAAPTAGLHFDEPMLQRLDDMGVERAFVTLHVGAGTFQPVDTEDLSQHAMHAERYSIPAATVSAIAATHARRGRVIAVGTTSLRALEAAAEADGQVRAVDAETALFITPGYRFRVTDCLLTNFHLPRSTLLMLVSAFAGYARIRAAYVHAIGQHYRFFSYGDAMFLERDTS